MELDQAGAKVQNPGTGKGNRGELKELDEEVEGDLHRGVNWPFTYLVHNNALMIMPARTGHGAHQTEYVLRTEYSVHDRQSGRSTRMEVDE